MSGLAGLPVGSPPGAPALDGVDGWGAIARGEAAARTEVLLNLCPEFAVLAGAQIRPGWTQAAYRRGDWKLIVGLPGDSDDANKTCVAPSCKNGWQRPPPPGAGWPAPEPPEPATYKPGIWLFNITADPYERSNVAMLRPNVVAELLAAIALYNRTNVWQASSVNPRSDPKSNPVLWGGVWSPWLPATVPQKGSDII